MNIVFVLASEDNLVSAGVRIRYSRLLPYLERLGHNVTVVPINELNEADKLDGDVFIFCKCHDVRSVVLADMLRRKGAQVGIDLFDDYFSQETNSRFVHLRSWFRAMAPNLSFAICSTPMMRRLINNLLPGVPGHIINDPFETLEAEKISLSVEKNVERALSTRVMDVAWFGMGDNPHFSVGLQDLFAFGETIRSLRTHGFSPSLSVLTNRRALTADSLELLGRMGVPVRLEEWSVPLERELIESSLVSYLPVNAQTFSVAKSLNRAVTALTGGSQVLSEGYPLYSELGSFIYRDVEALVSDITAERPLLRRETLGELAGMLATKAHPAHETEAFVDFLQKLEPACSSNDATYAVIHGRKTTSMVHKQIQKLRQLSVGSPFQTTTLVFDIRFSKDEETGKPGLLLTRQAYMRLRKPLRSRLSEPKLIGKQNFWFLPSSALPIHAARSLFARGPRYFSIDISEYASVMHEISTLVSALFGSECIFVSELESPSWVSPGPSTVDVGRNTPAALAMVD